MNTAYLTGILPGMELLAMGFSLVFIPVTMTALAGVERRVSGVASAMLNVSQQVGGALGLSALVTVSATATAGRLAAAHAATVGAALPGATLNEALVHGWTTGFRLAVVFAVVALVIAATAIRPGRPVPQPSVGAAPEGEAEEIRSAGSEDFDELPVAG